MAFIATGLRNFTKGGYERQAPSFNASAFEGVSLEGKHIMVTGANSGIGADATRQFLEMGATVHMVCRSEEKAREAIAEFKNGVKEPRIHLHLLDLSDLPAVKAFGRAFVASGIPLYCLVNNAGAMIHGGKLQGEGIEVNFAVNTLGTFILTEELLPSLKAYASSSSSSSSASPSKAVDTEEENKHSKNDSTQETTPSTEVARVVTVSSGGMLTKDLDIGETQVTNTKEKDGTFIYASNKRQQVCLTEYWSEKHGGDGVWFQSMHPGWVDTPAVRTSMPDFHKKMDGKVIFCLCSFVCLLIFLCFFFFFFFLRLSRSHRSHHLLQFLTHIFLLFLPPLQLRDLQQGSDTIVWLGASKEALSFPAGGFFLDRTPQKKHLTLAWSSYKPEEVEQLHALLTRLRDSKIPEPDEAVTNRYSYLTEGKLIEE